MFDNEVSLGEVYVAYQDPVDIGLQEQDGGLGDDCFCCISTFCLFLVTGHKLKWTMFSWRCKSGFCPLCKPRVIKPTARNLVGR